jgi:pyruvate formate lyase activating enzyme
MMAFPAPCTIINIIMETEVATRYWHALADGRLQCDLCPRHCRLHDGQRGMCFVRRRLDDTIKLVSYGRSSGFCVDPIEKKPLHHFLPGSAVLSFGTAGCNLACKYCQNWDISRSRNIDTLGDAAGPAQLARAAVELGCRSVAFTYNDPVIFLEYAVDVATACRERGLRTVAVTAGYIDAEPRVEFFKSMDAANVDLKGFTETFYRKTCGARLAPVLETLEYIRHETSTWLELTTLLIHGYNDSDAELHALTGWVVERLGADVPIHFTAFHPDWKVRNVPPTPSTALLRARKIAISNGLRYAYTGNIYDRIGSSTFCHHCGALLIERDWYQIERWGLDPHGRCATCNASLPGCFEALPGHFGARRIPVRLSEVGTQSTRLTNRIRPARWPRTTPSKEFMLVSKAAAERDRPVQVGTISGDQIPGPPVLPS